MDLAHALSADSARFGPECGWVTELHGALHDVIRQETGAFEWELLTDYAEYDPDRDTRRLSTADEGREVNRQRLLRHLGYLLEKANFEHMQAAQLDAVVAQTNSLGLRVLLDPTRVEHLSIWIRGQATITRTHRLWWNPLRTQHQRLEVFKRLVIIFQLREMSCIELKMFKDIPVADVEALLPHAEVGMNISDRAQLYLGSAGALTGALWKLTQFLLSGAIQFTTVLTTFLLGTAMLTFKAITGYRRTRLHRDSQRTRHLYFQNVANNAAVIHAVLAMIAEEESKEAFLAYLFQASAPTALSVEELRRRVEDYLRQHFEIEVRFDVVDAIETLQRLRLTAASDPNADAEVEPWPTAVDRLRDHWRLKASWSYHRTMADRADLPLRTTLTLVAEEPHPSATLRRSL